MSDPLPEPLRKSLSKAGKEGIKHLTFEDRSRGGKKGWQTRLRKARELADKLIKKAEEKP